MNLQEVIINNSRIEKNTNFNKSFLKEEKVREDLKMLILFLVF